MITRIASYPKNSASIASNSESYIQAIGFVPRPAGAECTPVAEVGFKIRLRHGQKTLILLVHALFSLDRSFYKSTGHGSGSRTKLFPLTAILCNQQPISKPMQTYQRFRLSYTLSAIHLPLNQRLQDERILAVDAKSNLQNI